MNITKGLKGRHILTCFSNELDAIMDALYCASSIQMIYDPPPRTLADSLANCIEEYNCNTVHKFHTRTRTHKHKIK